jgi:ATP-dependent DNA helicase RecG
LKREIPENNQIVKSVVGFCNMHGGRIILGVGNDGEVIGVEEPQVEELLEYLHKTIYESCTPSIIPDIFSQRVNDKLVLVIRVSSGGNKPYFIRSLGMEKGTYVRMGRSTLRADAATIADLQRQHSGISYDRVPLYNAPSDSIDPVLVERFLKNRTLRAPVHAGSAVLRSYHLIAEEHTKPYPTAAGILLFSRHVHEWFPEAFIICSRFRGTSGRDATSSRDCTGTLFEQFDASYAFVVENLNRSFTIKGKRRKEVLELPPVAIREVLLNALVHRNYAIAGSIKVAIFDDRIEVFSPGVFPGPIDVNNLLSGITYIRNTAIAKVFREAGYIEKLGSGFIALFELYDRWGLEPPRVVEGENFVKCILPRTKREPEHDAMTRRLLNLFDRGSEIAIRDVIAELRVSRATAGRYLADLESKGMVETRGSGPATRYIRG